MAQRLTDTEVNAGCVTARDLYLALDTRTARLSFAYQLQGFIAAQVARGDTLEYAIDQVNALIKLLKEANPS